MNSRGKSREESKKKRRNRKEEEEKDKEVSQHSKTCSIYWRGDGNAELLRCEANRKARGETRPTTSVNNNEVSNGHEDEGEEDEEWNQLHAGLYHRTQTDDIDDNYTSEDRIFKMKQRIKLGSSKLQDRLSSFLTPRSLRAQTDYLEKLKFDILTNDFEERKNRKERKSEKIDSDIRMSKATLSVADLQCQVSKEHGTLIKIEERLTQLRQVDDEFSKRTTEAIEEEKELRQHQAFRCDRVLELEAKLATSLAVEARVHRECESVMHQLKTSEKVAYLGKVQAIRDHEDAVATMNERVRQLAAHRIQAAFRVMMLRSNIVVVFDDEEKQSIAAAKSIQSKIRMFCTKKKVRAVSKKRFEKHYDRESGFFFYTDIQTGESQWTKPKMFGDEDIGMADLYTDKHLHDGQEDGQEEEEIRTKRKQKKHKKRKKKVEILTEDGAATIIQKCFRGWMGRRHVKEIVFARFEKLYDEESGAYYYWDTVAETSQWHKPKVLGPNDDIEIEI